MQSQYYGMVLNIVNYEQTILKLNSTLGFSKHILLNKPFINTACMHILWT